MEKSLRKKVAAIGVASALLGSNLAYTDAVFADEKVETNNENLSDQTVSDQTKEREIVNDDSIKYEGIVDNEQDAKDKIKEKEKEYNDKGYKDITSDITEIKTKEETGNVIEKQLESEITVEKDKYTDLSKEEAENKKQELEVDNHDKKVTVVIKSYMKDTGKDEIITIKKNFNSREEANAYIESLKDQGYTISEESLTQNTKEEAMSFNMVFNTQEEAETAIREFDEKYDNVISNIDIIRNESKDQKETTKGTVKYDNIEDAIKAKEELETDNSVYTITATIRKEAKQNKIEEIVKSEKFTTQEEALKYIENLKKQGYDVSDLEVKLLSYEESIWKDEEGVEVDPGKVDGKTFNYSHFDVTLITSFTKIDSEGNESTVKGTVKVNDVNISGKDVKMTGPSKDPNSGLTEYTSVSRNGLNVTNKSLVKITGTVIVDGKELPFTVEGYLSEAQNVCAGRGNSKGYDLEFKKITIINNKVLVDTNIITSYQVEGTITKNEEKTEYYVDSLKTTKGYDYNASATGTQTVEDDTFELIGKASKDILEEKYSLDVTTENKKYEYEKEIIEKTLYGVTVIASNLQKEEEQVIETNNNQQPTLKNNDNNPQTGDNINIGLLAGAAGVSAVSAGYVLTRKRKRN